MVLIEFANSGQGSLRSRVVTVATMGKHSLLQILYSKYSRKNVLSEVYFKVFVGCVAKIAADVVSVGGK